MAAAALVLTAGPAVPATADDPLPKVTPCSIVGTPGPDVLVGTPRDDVICGRGGDDRIRGRGGDDTIGGGGGDDVIDGGAGADEIHADNGDDRILGGTGADDLGGGPGADLLRGDDGDDEIRGGRGDDVAQARDASSYVDTVTCGAGADDRVRANPVDDVAADCEIGGNKAPVAVDDTFSTAEDTDLDLPAVGATGPADNDTDADGDPLDVVGVSAPSGGTVVLDAGTITFTPDADLCGTAAGGFGYEVSDGTDTETGEVTVDIDCTPDDPVAEGDAATVDEDDPATAVDVLANDSDADGDALTIDSVTQPANGAVVITGGGDGPTYAPDAHYCNTPPGTTPDTFDYTLTGGPTATVSVTVTCADDDPTAVTDTATVAEDDPATAIDVLANDTDIDGGPFAITGTTQSANGTVVITGGGSGLTCVNDAPLADDETFTASDRAVGNTTLVVNDPTDAAPSATGPQKAVTGDLLAGDTDPDSGALTVVADSITTADGGSVELQADGDFVYTPSATSCTDTTDQFDYTVSDEHPDEPKTDVGTVTIEITGCVWYVSNAAAGNAGTSTAPFDTLAQAETASAAGHTIYLYDGDDTTTGYGAITLKSGQRLLGELADLQVGADLLATGVAGKRPTLAAAGAVVTLASGNTVRGVQVDPGSAEGIVGGSGDAGGTIDDVRIIDTAPLAAAPALRLLDTSGAFTVSDLTVDGAGVSVVNNSGTVSFVPSSTVAITASGVPALVVDSSNLDTSAFDSVTAIASTGEGISLSDAAGTATFGDISVTTNGTGTAFHLDNAPGVTVAGGSTADLSATGGPAVEALSSPGATLSFDNVSSSGSATDGVRLSGLGTGTFTASSGTISGATGTAFDLSGGSGDVTYTGTITNGSGSSVAVANRTGGTATFSGAITDNSDAAGGISLLTNSGGSTVFSGQTTLDTGTSHGVSMTSSNGHTMGFTGGLDVVTTSGRGFDADNSGTVTVTGAGNTISSTGGGRALSVANTDIGADDLTFQSVTATGGGSNGIVLDTTGTAGNLAVTGNGGTCTIADTSGCSGGTIAGVVGADDIGIVPVGTAIVLRNTTAPSFDRIRINNATNYGIRGTNVAGLTLSNSVLHGTIGTSALTAHKDGGLRFEELTGTVNVSDTAVSGGYFTNVMVDNTAGSLDATFDNVDSLALDATGGDDAVQFEGIGTAAMDVVLQDSQITTASGDLFQYIGDGTGGGDLDFTGNTLSNNEPSIATGGGGVAIVGGAKGAVTLDILNNTMRDSLTNALTVIKSRDAAVGTNNLVATIDNNDIGVAGTANSGSAEGDGMEITTFGDGNATFTVTNNDIRQYNSSGIQFVAGSGIADTGQFNLNISGNSISNPGTNPLITLLQGIRMDSGVASGDTFATCVDFGANSITGSSDAANKDFRLVASQSTTIRQPGFSGGPTDGAAFANHAASLIGGSAQGTAVANSPATFSGSGTSCP